MIAAKDFHTTIGHSDKGVFVRVVHVPTGNELMVNPVADEPVGRAVQRLIAELAYRVFNPTDFVTQHIRAKPKGFMRVVHLPSGKYRDSDGKKNATDLQDELLNELVQEHALEKE
jgi:hypothetical protein